MKRNRAHFSYSQLALWESSKKAYWKKYGLGIDTRPNAAQRKGSNFMIALETGELRDEDEMLSTDLLLSVPKYDNIERVIETNIKVGDIEVPLLGIIDSCTDDYSLIIDYKTGGAKSKWKQAVVEKDAQLEFYAALIYLAYGHYPARATIVWIKTEKDESGKIVYSGEHEMFHRTFTTKQVIDMINRIKTALIEIEEYEYEEAFIDDSLAGQYAALVKEKKELEHSIDLLKDKIMLQLFEGGHKYASSGYGNFTLSERTTWKYGANVKAALEFVGKAQEMEQELGVASKTVTTSLLFTPKK